MRYPKAVDIGSHCFINYGCTMLCVKGSRIRIGDSVDISSGVTICAVDYPGNTLLLDGWVDIPKEVTIGDGVWIGQGVSIFGNAHIGPYLSSHGKLRANSWQNGGKYF